MEEQMRSRSGMFKGQPGFWSGTLFGMVTGMASLLSYQYFSGILRQPRLISKEIFSDDQQFENKEVLAAFIAAENLRSGIQARYLTRGLSKEILHAGYRNFRESWARDFGFAAYGLLALEQYETVRDTLESFFWHQTGEGQLPVKLHSMNSVSRFLHSLLGREQPTEAILRPKYVSGHGAPSLDGQALLVIAALEYARQAEDPGFLKMKWDTLELAMQWLRTHANIPDKNLLRQEAYADWADSIDRSGYALYTNVVYWKALSEMALAAASLDLNQEAVYYMAEAESASGAIQEMLWRPDLGYFVTSENLEQLCSVGNLLAIAWGLTAPEQAESILEIIREKGLSEPVPTRVAYPAYPANLIAIENRIGGLANYHTEAAWLWIGAWHVIALLETNRPDEARQVLERIADVIVRDRQVSEAHRPDGEPLASRWYKSEAPLTWNAGMVIYACQRFEEYRLSGN